MGASRNKTAVLRAGVDFQKFDTISPENREFTRKKFGFTENDIVLFFMGWLYDFSGIREILLEMAKDIWIESPVKLLIVGTGDSWTEMNRVIKEKGLQKKVVVEDWRPYAEIPALVMASDICILPALKNKIMMNIVPIKMYEYMAAGKPVIATSLPGLMKEFGTTNGVSYINRPEEALSIALQLSKDRRMAEEGRKARMFVEKSDWMSLTQTFEALLENLSRSSPITRLE
jgi:glycosyltransferase involved in cell wall biosynthesis